jgi:hypothetical protein
MARKFVKIQAVKKLFFFASWVYKTLKILMHTPIIGARPSIVKTVPPKLCGKLKRKSSGGERAWILEEGSEPRN